MRLPGLKRGIAGRHSAPQATEAPRLDLRRIRATKSSTHGKQAAAPAALSGIRN